MLEEADIQFKGPLPPVLNDERKVEMADAAVKGRDPLKDGEAVNSLAICTRRLLCRQ